MRFTARTERSADRLAWWREARFGMFIHWGLYSILAGEWGGRDDYAEWIRNNAHIPLEVYDRLLTRFNPVRFDADQWVGDGARRRHEVPDDHHEASRRVLSLRLAATPISASGRPRSAAIS